MENIRIQYFGSVRAAAGRPEDESPAAGMSLYSLLLKLAGDYGEAFRGELLAAGGGKLRDDLTVTVNGAIISHEAAEEIVLRPGDTLALFPIFPGGG